MIIPLAFAECNKYHKIKNINGKNKNILAEKGFCCGSEVCLLKNLDNNSVVKMGCCQYVIGFGFAKDIMVEA